ALLAQERQGLLAVFHVADPVAHFTVLQGFDGEASVIGTVFDEQNLDGLAVTCVHHGRVTSSNRCCQHCVPHVSSRPGEQGFARTVPAKSANTDRTTSPSRPANA